MDHFVAPKGVTLGRSQAASDIDLEPLPRGPGTNTPNGWLQTTSEHNPVSPKKARPKGGFGRHQRLQQQILLHGGQPSHSSSYDVVRVNYQPASLEVNPTQRGQQQSRLSYNRRTHITHKGTLLENSAQVIRETVPLSPT